MAYLAAAILALSCSGCTDAAIRAAREQLKAGDFASAHAQFATALRHREKLSAREIREALDGICSTEFRIGEPTYPLDRQRADCAAAAREPGSRSGPILSEIESELRTRSAVAAATALKAGNLESALAAARWYAKLPGANSRQLAEWSSAMWKLVADQERQRVAHPRTHGRLKRAIRRLRRALHLSAHASPAGLESWIRKHAVVDHHSLFSSIQFLDKSHLRLTLSPLGEHVVGRHFETLAAINDRLAALCGCPSLTEVGTGPAVLPAYLVRLDPATGKSEVLVFE